jgi:TnpA family transposase
MHGLVTPHMLSFVNRRHVSVPKLEAALKDLINAYHRFALPKVWGEGKTAAADGTKYDLYEQNLISEYHIRYGSHGGIAYHHIADSYVALFSHFIPCGVWEAIYIIEGLLRNTSDIQPEAVTADTQGQSTPVFGLAHLLGIKLMPRIRNWKGLILFRPSTDCRYEHIESMFGEPVDWGLIKTHWQDLLRVVLSIKAGKVSSAVLLRKLGNYSRKNRLYQAFRELGRVVRTVFLLQFVSDPELRESITAAQNKVEAYNGFAKWVFFGGEGVIAQNDPDAQEKAIKYNDLVATAAVFQNVVDMSVGLRNMIEEGFPVTREDVATLSPYITRNIKRFGEYVIDLGEVPEPLEGALALAI